ncbi:MAG: RHS repeat-associated core domain-containing protein, partial [Anaerolineales bacterium]|nr:RHS repeat-associated core domain-containing protein [Anaerolineales bacterium]
TVTDDGSVTDYTTNNMNQYSQVGDVTYTYDTDGNMTSKIATEGTTTYEYDVENRLIRVATPTSGTWEYTYDALGNRVGVTHDGVATHYVHDPAGLVDVAAEYDASGALVARYTHGLGLVARVDAVGDAAFYSYDATGNTRQLTDDAGAVANTYDYTPFGVSLEAEETVPNPFQYVGRYGVMDEGNGLTFMRARYYDERIGRFVTPDPLGLTGGDDNLYLYAKNNPLSIIDPEGTAVPLILVWAGVGGFCNSIVYLATTDEITAGGLLGAAFEGLVTGLFAGATGGFSLGTSLGVGALGSAGRYVIEKWVDQKLHEFSWRELIGEITVGGLTNVIGQFTQNALPSVAQGHWNAGGPGFWRTLQGLNKHGLHIWSHQIADTLTQAELSCIKNVMGVAQSEVIRPGDPNEKVGPQGFGEEHIVTIDQELFYTIYFENVMTATAPAQEVNIVDYLDSDLDWQTFDVTEIAFGDRVIAVQEETDQYYTQATIPDYRVEIGKDWWVDITVQLDYQTGEVSWGFRTLNPDTGELPDDPLAGFLPPNDETGRGEGHVVFSIWPQSDLPKGTMIANEATITFDTELAITTNEVWNTIGEISFSTYLPLLLRDYP